jgi:predicted DNA-binding transcriptional regulator AlpA
MSIRRHALSSTHFTTPEVSELTGLGRNQIAKLEREGSFPLHTRTDPRAGRTALKLYLKVEVQRWLAKHL